MNTSKQHTADDSAALLRRFLTAQAPVYADVLDELSRGRKQTHWMWFIFPQLKELGRSSTARHYGIASRDEALAYIQHPVLGARLHECATLLLGAGTSDAHRIFGSPDDLKLRSCMTLFAAVAPNEAVFRQVLDKFYAGVPDAATVTLLA